MSDNVKKVGLLGLVTIVFASMVGSSVYNLPQNMAAGAAAGAVLIAWIVTGVGMYFLAQTFSILSNVRPDITSGIYAYAEQGFGRYTGFNSAWGYWVSGAIGNVAFAVLLNDAVGYFYAPLLEHGWQTVVFGLVIIWIMSFLVMPGVEFATKLSSYSIFVVIIAIIVITGLMIYYFQWDKFITNFWGDGLGLGGVSKQVSSTMMVTLWSFIGIEGAVVIAGKAKKSSDVGKATIIGLISALSIYAVISLLSFGILDQPGLTKLQTPSAGYIFESTVNTWGNEFVNIAVIISLLVSWLAWTVLVAVVPQEAAKEGVLPKVFAKVNKQDSPINSLIITALLMSVMMVVVVMASDVYLAAVSICGVMVIPPYVLSAGFLWKSAEENLILKDKHKQRMQAIAVGAAAALFGGYLLYAAGVSYLLMSLIFYALGIPFYYMAHKNDLKAGKHIFTKAERLFAIAIVIGAGIAIMLMMDGTISA